MTNPTPEQAAADLSAVADAAVNALDFLLAQAQANGGVPVSVVEEAVAKVRAAIDKDAPGQPDGSAPVVTPPPTDTPPSA